MKRYVCSECGLKQKIKEQLMKESVVHEGDRAVKGWFSTCVRCKRKSRMLPVHKED